MKDKEKYNLSFTKWLFARNNTGMWLAFFLVVLLIGAAIIKPKVFISSSLMGASFICSIVIFIYLRIEIVKESGVSLSQWKEKFFFPQRRNLFKHVYVKNDNHDLKEKEVFEKDFNYSLLLHKIFIKEFSLIFLSYSLLYLWLLIVDDSYGIFRDENQWYRIVTFTFNNLGAWFLFRSFVILFIPSKRHHPDIIISNLFNFSFYLLISLSFVYALALLKYDNKKIIESGEIGVISNNTLNSDSLTIYDKRIQAYDTIYNRINSKVLSKNKEDSIRNESLSNLKAFYLKKTVDSLLKENINSKPFFELALALTPFRKLKNTVDSLSKRISYGNPNLKLALVLTPFLKYTDLKIPKYFVLTKGDGLRNKVHNTIKLRTDTIPTHVDINNSIVTVFTPPLTSETIVYTNLNIQFDRDSLMPGATIKFPAYIRLYQEKKKDSLFMLFDVLSGLINALAFALLIGRLDSRFIGIGKVWIFFLFLYPAIQPLYIVFAPDSLLRNALLPSVISAALVLKIFLCLVVNYLSQSGRLLTYLFCLGDLDKRSDAIFENQFEIIVDKNDHHDYFYFFINNKNNKVLQSDEHFKTRDKCLEKIESFQRSIEYATIQKKNEHHNSTYVIWIDESIYSKSFSDKEANEFLVELKEKIPYCKITLNV